MYFSFWFHEFNIYSYFSEDINLNFKFSFCHQPMHCHCFFKFPLSVCFSWSLSFLLEAFLKCLVILDSFFVFMTLERWLKSFCAAGWEGWGRDLSNDVQSGQMWYVCGNPWILNIHICVFFLLGCSVPPEETPLISAYLGMIKPAARFW